MAEGKKPASLFVIFCNPHCPILKTTLHRLQLRIMSGPAGIRLQSVLSGRTEIFLSGAPLAWSMLNKLVYAGPQPRNEF